MRTSLSSRPFSRIGVACTRYAFGFLFAISPLVLAMPAYATWNGSPYSPETTLDPECPPTQPQCRVTQPVVVGDTVAPGSIPYTDTNGDWMAFPIGADGKVLKVSNGQLVWGDASSYLASEQGIHLATSTGVFSLALDGSSLTTSASGLKVSNSYAGQNSITTLGTISSGTWHGSPIAVAYGGTGTSTTPTNGQVLIGNGSGYTAANIMGTDGITITNGSGSLGIGFSIPNLQAVTSTAGTDYVTIYDSGSGQNKKISISDLFSSINGALNYRGSWNANSNTPTLTDGMCTSGTKGYYYVVSQAGTTTLGGNSSWNANDWVICDGTSWGRIQTTNSVSSVFGRTGVITAQTGDYSASQVTNAPSGTVSSTNVQSAIDELATEKEPVIIAGTTSQYYRGDKTWQTLDTLAVTENAAHLYYTDARARAAVSSGSASLVYDPSTGAFRFASGYSLPKNGNSSGDTLVWDGTTWVPNSTFSVSTSTGTVSANALTLSTALTASSGGTGITTPLSGSVLIGTSGGWQQMATSSLGIALSDTVGSLGVLQGGTGLTIAPTYGQVLVGNGSGGFTTTATSSLGISLSTIAGTLSVAQGGTGSTSLGQGWLYSNGSGLAITASTSPTVNYLVATSTTIASTIASRLGIGTTSPIARISIKGTGTGSGITLQTTDSLNTPVLTVLDSGQVGIGTSSPYASLAVNAVAGIAPLVVGSPAATKLIVDATGYVGIGNATPSYPLDVKGDVSGTVARFQTTGGSLICALSAFTGLLSCSSDERLKKDITPIDASTTASVLALNPVSYHWKTDSDSDALKYGFIAQDVQKLFPQLVTTDPTTGYYTLATTGLIPFMVKTIQDEQNEIDTINAHVGANASNSLALSTITDLTDSGTLAVSGHVTFGADTVGEVTLPSGNTTVSVTFATPYGTKPVVTISPEGDVNGSYWVDSVTQTGFAISVHGPQQSSTAFSWHAFQPAAPISPTVFVAPDVSISSTSDSTSTSTDQTTDTATTTDSTPVPDVSQPTPSDDSTTTSPSYTTDSSTQDNS